jgi:DNA replication protein DnaC
MRRLDQFDVVFLDDIGYANRGEIEVLFNFLAERYPAA